MGFQMQDVERKVFYILKILNDAEEALGELAEIGVGKKGEALDERQWLNWIGSGKVWFKVIEGEKRFSQEHIRKVGTRYVESNGRAYSLYHYDQGSGRVIEHINTYQCARLWCVERRQAANRIVSGQVPHLKVGNEYFVPRWVAEGYRVAPPLPSSERKTHPGR